MKTIVNKTRRPLTIKLGRGRVLRLGPAKEGQVATHDADRDSVKALVEAGDVEIFDDLSRTGSKTGSVSGGRSSPQAAHRQFSGAKRGDR